MQECLNQNPILQVINNIDHNSCPKYVNFHCHSTFSDGSLDPLDIFKQACDLNIKHLAITDHHSVSAFSLINESISNNVDTKYKTKLWTGIEISCILKKCLVNLNTGNFLVKFID